ncbi:DinB family protein [Leucobacter sp. HNU]|uniref:DinB family protein n=1 Tax=Leucobacter sp. HNU TaxID=3236805 RepID=UPI003A804B36
MIASEKDLLRAKLDEARGALLWKLDGLGEYELRRPMTPTGTNLLGLVKHTASVELDYFGRVFGRPTGIPLPWFADDAEPNADMWAPADQTSAEIIALSRAAAERTAATIDALDLDAEGTVPWWARNPVTLRQIIVHVTAEYARHAGHADIVRELIDGAAGMRPDATNLPAVDGEWLADYRQRLEAAAHEAARRSDARVRIPA